MLPIVNEITCLRSNAAFVSITSHRTFCVGDRAGRGPCQGKYFNTISAIKGSKFNF
jgi:hypothetical protein